MFHLRSILVLLFLALSSATARLQVKRQSQVPNVPELRTNAARLAAGLSPLPPVRRNPTRVEEKRTRTSSSPGCEDHNQEYIKVYCKSSGNLIGYLKQDTVSGSIKAYGITSSKDSAMQITFSSTPSNPFDLSITGSGTYPYLGFAGNDLTSGSSNANALVATKHTNPNSVASIVGNLYSSSFPSSESSVWAYNTGTKELTPQWVNSNGSKAPTYLVYDPNGSGYIQITGDVAKFQSAHPAAYVVQFFVFTN